MRKTTLAIGAAAGICLIGTAVPVAFGQAAHPSAKKGFHATVSPAKPKQGQRLKVKATGAKPGATYYCVLTLNRKGITGSASLADTATLETVKASPLGKISCNQEFVKFKGSYKGKKHSCPPTKADKKKGWGCGVGLANQAKLSNEAVAAFKF